MSIAALAAAVVLRRYGDPNLQQEINGVLTTNKQQQAHAKMYGIIINIFCIKTKNKQQLNVKKLKIKQLFLSKWKTRTCTELRDVMNNSLAQHHQHRQFSEIKVKT